MASINYEPSLARVLAHEGGYTNHPSDPGGPTNFGITIADYRRYVKFDANAADVRAMMLDEAKAIYRSKYWDALRCNELPAGVDYVVFDYGVNSGIARSGRVLRLVFKFSDNNDTVTDEVIVSARMADAKSVITAICDERLRFLQSLKTWNVFGKGWGRRVADVKAVALAMAADVSPPMTVNVAVRGRGVVPVSKTGQYASAGVIATATIATTSHVYRSAQTPAMAVLIAAAAILLALGSWWFWNWLQRWQQKKPA